MSKKDKLIEDFFKQHKNSTFYDDKPKDEIIHNLFFTKGELKSLVNSAKEECAKIADKKKIKYNRFIHTFLFIFQWNQACKCIAKAIRDKIK